MKIIFFAGTRPEAIKISPVVRYFRKHNHKLETLLCSTGQHKEMLTQVFRDFNLVPDIDLNLIQPNQSLANLSSRLFQAVDKVLDDEKPDWIMVQGDTTTVMIASLCAFYRGIKIGHIEAGLRSFDRFQPFPEEINRRVAGLLADKHFSPTQSAKDNLIKENVPEDAIIVTGNTVIDALLLTIKKMRHDQPQLPENVEKIVSEQKPYVLVTGHRRESFGQNFRNICLAINDLSRILPEMSFVFPVHLNPNVQKPVLQILGSSPGVHLIKPQAYRPFVRLMNACTLILTDSGGIQEEAPSLGKPVLVMRDVTERPEGIRAGTSKLVGTDRYNIVSEVSRLLADKNEYIRMANTKNPFGDGRASEIIFQNMEELKL